MDIGLECLPCVLNQTIAASRLATDDEKIQKEIIYKMTKVLSEADRFQNAPQLYRESQRIITALTGESDPYKDIKKQHIEAVLDYYPHLLSFIEEKEDQLYWALKIAAVGNSIDLGMFSEIDIDEIIKKELASRFVKDDYPIFKEKIRNAKSILILGDNAGETVFDRILLDFLPDVPITYAVRDKPVINDAVIKDAIASKLNEKAKIISSGSSGAGTILSEITEEFRSVYNNADIIISKGQGNYETLSEEVEREIFFLFKSKCALVSRLLNVTPGDYIFISNFYNQ